MILGAIGWYIRACRPRLKDNHENRPGLSGRKTASLVTSEVHGRGVAYVHRYLRGSAVRSRQPLRIPLLDARAEVDASQHSRGARLEHMLPQPCVRAAGRAHDAANWKRRWQGASVPLTPVSASKRALLRAGGFVRGRRMLLLSRLGGRFRSERLAPSSRTKEAPV